MLFKSSSSKAEAKRAEAEAESAQASSSSAPHDDLPTYTPTASSGVPELEEPEQPPTEAAPGYAPPQNEASESNVLYPSLANGDPNEIIEVPMLASVEKPSVKRFLTGKKTIEQRVTVRKMKRGHYLMHYAKDVDGNYIGSGKAAHDASLVYVPSKSSKEDIQEQIYKTATSKEHYRGPAYGHVGMASSGFIG
ncbi:hypothetical protein NA57DRAFT_76119 [Rhizodiscina lignyota]|uniref:Uncharacterized protein n=1 Tax=Rhizodiscina lignyota TaxID=1504668 RepID=A0A9P4IGQ5_9PEZI|nr:hypothetical protein NA57DRAFT_76119 [Rhizodiscina lignyota]